MYSGGQQERRERESEKEYILTVEVTALKGDMGPRGVEYG